MVGVGFIGGPDATQIIKKVILMKVLTALLPNFQHETHHQQLN